MVNFMEVERYVVGKHIGPALFEGSRMGYQIRITRVMHTCQYINTSNPTINTVGIADQYLCVHYVDNTVFPEI